MPSRHDRLAIMATKHGTFHTSERPEQNGRYNYYRILSWSLGHLSTYDSMAWKEPETSEGVLLQAPIPKSEGGYY